MSTIEFKTELSLDKGCKLTICALAGEDMLTLCVTSASGNEITVPIKKSSVGIIRKHLGLVNSYVRETAKDRRRK